MTIEKVWVLGVAIILLLAFGAGAGAETERQNGQFIDGESNLREGPGTGSKVICQPAKGTFFQVLEKKGAWYNVQFSDGTSGWTNQKNIRLNTGENNNPSGEEDMEKSHKMRVNVDVNGDGQPEEVSLKLYKKEPGNGDARYYHLLVTGAGKKVLWEDTANKHPFVLGDFGVEDLQVVGDVDGDGQVEILTAEAQSDVSPTYFRMFRWGKDRFALAGEGYLEGDAATPKTFAWVKAKNKNETVKCWILHFDREQKEGVLVASSISVSDQGTAFGRALVKAAAGGFAVEKWLEPMKVGE